LWAGSGSGMAVGGLRVAEFSLLVQLPGGNCHTRINRCIINQHLELGGIFPAADWPWHVLRSQKAQNWLFISFHYKIFREYRWFRTEVRENSQKHSNYRDLLGAIATYSAVFIQNSSLLWIFPSDLHFLHVLLQKQGQTHEIYARCLQISHEICP